jgi:hypothetical protein
MRGCSYINTRHYVERRVRQLSLDQHVTVRGRHERVKFLPILCRAGNRCGQDNVASSSKSLVEDYLPFTEHAVDFHKSRLGNNIVEY